MIEDKNLKEIITQWGSEETSEDFTIKTMQLIQALPARSNALKTAANNKVKKAFIITFSFVLLTLVIASFFIKPSELPFNLNDILPRISYDVYKNLTAFILVLWLFLFINYKFERTNCLEENIENFR